MNLNFNFHLTFRDLLPVYIALFLGLAMLGYLYYRDYREGKNISTWRMIIWIVWTFLLYAVLGLVSIKIDVLPWAFAVTAICSVLLGILYLVLSPLTLDWWQKSNLLHLFLTNGILLCFGICGFSLLFNMLATSSSVVYALLPAMLSFLLPTLISTSYGYWMRIPGKKYKTWTYPVNQAVPRLQPIDTIKLVINFTPVPCGKNGPYENYEVELPARESLSDLFHYFISFHNKHREYRKKPIQYLEGDALLEWVLYKYNAQKKKVYLDMDKTLIENQLSTNDHIYAFSSL